jgi:L-serine/L-threonine ammonia-lyase
LNTKIKVDDQKFLVELACSTTLVPAYHPALFDKIVDRKDGKRPVVVFVVCGGFKIDLVTAEEYRRMVTYPPTHSWSVEYDDGELFSFPKKSK